MNPVSFFFLALATMTALVAALVAIPVQQGIYTDCAQVMGRSVHRSAERQVADFAIVWAGTLTLRDLGSYGDMCK